MQSFGAVLVCYLFRLERFCFLVLCSAVLDLFFLAVFCVLAFSAVDCSSSVSVYVYFNQLCL